MVETGYLANLAHVRDTIVETLVHASIPVVSESSEDFLTDLPSLPPDRDIDICIDLERGIQHHNILINNTHPTINTKENKIIA